VAAYEVKERKLIVNPEEANLVRRLFRLYLELGSVLKICFFSPTVLRLQLVH
jgi:hypothetical protein